LNEILGAIQNTPLPTILFLAGIFFWLLAIAGSIGGKITVQPTQQRTAGLVGSAFLLIGLILYFAPTTHLKPPTEGPQSEQPSPQPPFIHASPVISAVSTIQPAPDQSITVNGSGFGTQSPYDGISPFIMITDVTQNWNAGWSGPSGADLVTLSIRSWTDTQILIQGFTGRYGQENWTLNNEDRVTVKVWNPQTGAGPSSCTQIVGSASSSRCVSGSVWKLLIPEQTPTLAMGPA
jgi:hypothetical protein